MRLFIDECLSPQIARALNASGQHLGEHPLDFGGRGDPDHRVLQRCIAREFVIVTDKGEGISVRCGEVNSKNGFGGYSGYQRYVAGTSSLVFLE